MRSVVVVVRSEEGLEAWDDKFGRGWSRFIAALALLRSWNKLRHFSSYLVVGNSIFMATESGQTKTIHVVRVEQKGKFSRWPAASEYFIASC